MRDGPHETITCSGPERSLRKEIKGAGSLLGIPYYRKNLYVMWVATFLVSASWTQVMPFLPVFLSEMGVTEGLNMWAGIAISAHFVTGIFMMPVWGKLGDKYGRKAMAVRAGFSLSLIYLLTSFATAPWHVALLRLLNRRADGLHPYVHRAHRHQHTPAVCRPLRGVGADVFGGRDRHWPRPWGNPGGAF